MLYTSYFAQMRNFPNNATVISICGKAPEWYDGLQYKKVAPKYEFFTEWKKNHDNDFYIQHYYDEVLDGLDLNEVLCELYKLLPEDLKLLDYESSAEWWENPNIPVMLLCYEKPTDFCHRHLFATWLDMQGVPCTEWEK